MITKGFNYTALFRSFVLPFCVKSLRLKIASFLKCKPFRTEFSNISLFDMTLSSLSIKCQRLLIFYQYVGCSSCFIKV